MKSVVLEAEFSSAHFYHQTQWTDQKNKEVFGRCYNPFGHGHNYKIHAEWADVTDAEIPALKAQLSSIVSVIDHEHLNFTIPEFKNKVPTTEMILTYLEAQIQKNIVSKKLLNLELYETDDIGAQLK